MPTPATGLGLAVSKGLKKWTYAFYMAPASGAAAIPAAKLLANEAASPWVRQGRLRSDEFSWNIPEPGFMDGTAGFAKSWQFRIVNEAEKPTVTITLDETDPEVLNRLRGNAAGAATSLSSGAYTGYKYIYQTGLFYNAKVLLVGSGTHDTTERQVYGGNCYVTFRPTTAAGEVETLEVSVAFANDSSGNAITFQDWA